MQACQGPPSSRETVAFSRTMLTTDPGRSASHQIAPIVDIHTGKQYAVTSRIIACLGCAECCGQRFVRCLRQDQTCCRCSGRQCRWLARASCVPTIPCQRSQLLSCYMQVAPPVFNLFVAGGAIISPHALTFLVPGVTNGRVHEGQWESLCSHQLGVHGVSVRMTYCPILQMAWCFSAW